MCGITGIINKKAVAVDAVELRRMNDLIAHRGPDGEGFYSEGSVGFGHRRLAIIDLSQDGHQPMHYLGNYTITFNGEIYNYIEVRQTLIEFGYKFKSKSDTEVILAAYDKWGEECISQFNGMWAFAIHDKKKNIIFCSRDRFGVKPFYYQISKDNFSFGSEIKQLLNNESNQANEDLIAHFLYAGMHDHEERTFFQGVMKLPASHNLIYDLKLNNFSIKKYYSISRASNTNDYESVLIDAVKLRLRSDVKVGTCLSGGLDSSTIAAIASKFHAQASTTKFNAIHAQSIEKETDESDYAIEVAKIANLDLNIIKPGPEEFKSVLDEVVYTQEEPFGSPSIYLQYFVMKKAKEIGCKVLLDGQGGDETLLGYERYYAPVFINYLNQKGIWAAIKEIRSSNKNNSNMTLKNIAKYITGTYLLGIRLIYSRYKNSWFKKERIPKSFPYLKDIKDSSLDLFQMQDLELFRTNLQALLRYEDKNSMRHGIETRLPFIDYRSVECSLNLPIEKKVNNGWTKLILREICEKFLSSRIAWRKNKLGFNAPDKSWLNNIAIEAKKEIQQSTILKHYLSPEAMTQFPIANSWTITWRILNIALWEKIYKVKI